MSVVSSESSGRTPLHLLSVCADSAEVEARLAELRRAGYDPRADSVQTSHECFQFLAERNYDVVIADCVLPAWRGVEALELLLQLEKDVPFVLIGDDPCETSVADCLERGVAEFVDKTQLARLGSVVRRALDRRYLQRECDRLAKRTSEVEGRLRQLAELSPEPLFIHSEATLLFVNPVGVKLLGAHSKDQLIGKPLALIVHPDSRAAFEAEFERLHGSVQPVFFEGKLIRLDRQAVDAKIAATALTYEGRPAVQCAVHDVSERRRVEEAVKSLAAFAQYNPNPVLEFSRDGKLTYFNDAAAEVARALGKNHPGGILPPETVAIVQTCLSSGQKKLNLQTRNGSRTLSWSFFPIKQNQVVHCYMADVTDRQNLEAQLRHAQKVESVGRLAGGVAHDFNNLVTVMQGHIGLLRSEPNLGAQMRESLQQLSRAVERAAKLTAQLLTFSRRNIIQPRKVELNELLTVLGALLHRTLGEDITFQFSYAPDLPAVFGDAGLIEQVVMNLAVNARDAMSKGGILMITTSPVEIDQSYVERHPEARTGRFVCLSITDTGSGMDSITLSRLFEPFFTTKEFGKGSGLGLATSYAIVKQHGGWIDVSSQLGRGSTFKIHLPPAEAPVVKEISKAADTAARGRGETILIVEDEPPVRWTLKMILERYNYRVLEAGNGIEALAVWHQHQNEVALLLADIVMPSGLSGQELAEQFGAQKPDLKVLYMSGYSAQTAGEHLTDMEGLNFIQKPFDGPKLAKAVHRCLNG